MFGIDSTELIVCAIVALVVIGPKDLPKALRLVGNWIAKARGMARHFRAGLDTMMREAELEELEKTWANENERIMRDHPVVQGETDALASAPTVDPEPIPAIPAPLPPERGA